MGIPEQRSDATTAMAPADWSIERAAQYYNVNGWGAGFFSVNERGHVVVHPMGQPGPTIDLMDVVEDIRERRIGFPCVVRFQDVLRARVKAINDAFARGIAENGYSGRYFGVYPVKVNQMREVVEEILDAGAPYHYGLEAGSKGELLIVLGFNTDPDAITVCNKLKDAQKQAADILGTDITSGLQRQFTWDKMLGLDAISEVNNLVLTGPRGCGKTTVFRSLSLRHRVLTEDAAPTSLNYVGVYYRCDDLSFLFPRYRLPTRQDAWDLPVHFITATLLAELLESLAMWLPTYFSNEWNRFEAACTQSLWETLELEPPKHPSANSFGALIRALRSERERAATDAERDVADDREVGGETKKFQPGFAHRAALRAAPRPDHGGPQPVSILLHPGYVPGDPARRPANQYPTIRPRARTRPRRPPT